MKILLTACGGPSGICFAKSLSEIDGVQLVGTSAENDTIGQSFVESFHIVPLANDSSYLDELNRIVRDEGVDYVIPFVDEEMYILSQKADALACPVLVSPFETISFTANKEKMYDIAADYLPQRFTKPEINVFPVFAKPARGRGGKDTHIVTNEMELATIPEQGFIFQELLQNPEVSVDAFFDFDGTLVVAVPRIRASIDQGISVSGRVFRDDTLLSIVRDLGQRMKFIGPINFQFMRGRKGYMLTEINARGSGGMGITIRSGADMPKLSLELITTGAIARTPEINEGMYSNFAEVLERQRIKKESETPA